MSALSDLIETPKVELFPYQEDAVAWLCKRGRGLVQSPAGSGKTIIIAAAIYRVVFAKARDSKVRVLIIVNTLEQREQMLSAIKLFPGLLEAIELVVCCPASAPADFAADLLAIDECHHSPARTWLAIIERHRGCLWMASATAFGPDEERNATLRRLVDGNVFVVPREAVASRVVPAHVHLLHDTDSGLREPIDAAIQREIMRRRTYSKLDEGELYAQVAAHLCIEMGVVPNRARNAAIVRTVEQHPDDSTLILVAQIEHGQALSAAIPGSAMAYSKMGAKRRREAIAAFRERNLKCLIATSLADEGLDVPVANVLIMAGAGRSASRVEQRTGRVLRTYGGKTHGTVYDFADEQHPLLARQSQRRQETYRRLRYRIQTAPAARLELV